MDNTEKIYNKASLKKMSNIEIIKTVNESPELITYDGLDYAKEVISKMIDTSNSKIKSYSDEYIKSLPLLTANLNSQSEVELEIGSKKVCFFDIETVNNIVFALVSVMDTIRRNKNIEEKDDDIIIRYQLQKAIEEYIQDDIIDI